MKHLLCVVTLAILSSTWSNAQTIADVARQERAKRPAPAPAPKVSVTNKSLGVKPRPSDEKQADNAKPAAATTTTPGAAAAPSTPAAPPTDTRDEKWWRAQFDGARTDVRRAENQVAVAQLELNAANQDFLTRSFDPDGRGPAAVAAATKRLEDSNKALAGARAKFAQLEEELRRAGAPAGWAR